MFKFQEGTDMKSIKTPGPVITVLGTEENPAQVFVVIEYEIILCTSILSALDTLFKCFHIWNIEYPRYSSNIFLFLESHYYKMKTGKTISACVYQLIDLLSMKD